MLSPPGKLPMKTLARPLQLAVPGLTVSALKASLNFQTGKPNPTACPSAWMSVNWGHLPAGGAGQGMQATGPDGSARSVTTAPLYCQLCQALGFGPGTQLSDFPRPKLLPGFATEGLFPSGSTAGHFPWVRSLNTTVSGATQNDFKARRKRLGWRFHSQRAKSPPFCKEHSPEARPKSPGRSRLGWG